MKTLYFYQQHTLFSRALRLPQIIIQRKGKLSLFTTLAMLLLSLSVHGQASNKILINSGWEMQDAAIIFKEGMKAGWEMENAAKVPQEGKVISTVKYQPSGWYKATVPGTVLTTLVNNGVYPEPLYGENNRPEVIPEYLCHTDWWYRNEVTIPESYKNKTIWLNFDGINYSADIWVNGRRVGPIKGAFIRGNFDITPFVKPGQTAVIAVRISPQPNTGVPFEHIMGTVGGPCGGVGRLDGPTFGCSNGWDWLSGIRDRNSGIWQDVFLSATGHVLMKDPLITSDLPLPRTDKASVTVQTTVQNITGNAQKGIIKGSFNNVKFEKMVEIAPWRSLTFTFDPKEFTQLNIENPKLWWPNGLGEQNLYSMHLSFEIDGKVSDEKEITFGIREVSYDIPESENLGLTVNGVRIFCKGGNWGLDEALKRIDPKRLEAQIRMHKDANFNMIRLWGGQAASKILYDLCDKYGIMIWDEFWQFNAADPLDQDLYMANVRDKILNFRNHPSLVIWCARNEAYPPKYLDDAVRYVLAELDPLRHYQSNSGGGGGCNSGGPYEWQTPVDYYRFSESKKFNKKETFKTEIGPQSIPTLESIQGMMPEKDWTSITDAWAEHNFISGGGRNLMKTMTKRYGKVVNVADFVRKSQMMNYEGFRALYEGRIGKMFSPTQGILLWMSVPAQPSFVWQMFHYDLEPNASFFALQKACEQIHIQFNETENGIIQVINHEPKALSRAYAKITIYNIDGSVAAEKSYGVNASACSVNKISDIEWPSNLSPVHFIKLELRDSDGKLISDNFYWRGISSKPNDLTALESIPVVKLATKASTRTKDGKIFIDVILRNPSKNIALMTHLQLHRGKTGERVLPVYYSDNYISLAPKEERKITIEADIANFKGEKPLVLVDGWNIKVSSSTYIAPNKNAEVNSWTKSEFTFTAPKLEPSDEIRINCSGYNRDGFSKDPGFLEGALGYCTEDVDVSAPMSGPEAIYKTVRWGSCSYPNLMKNPNGIYTVRLHFAELDKNTPPGKRRFNVLINGKTVLTNLDVIKEAGSKFKALVKEIKGIVPDKDQKITIELKDIKSGAPQICGYEIFPE
ncbi:glycosyl hydrolase 2 galactose-binding domain-containing protein [Coprobacter sp.]|uniref:glycosyl hydrolase 2 galactose-binding domain-containing protein n=1 Tax=Coprobacter sp. TaxID=1941478 RepID=UPI003AB42144